MSSSVVSSLVAVTPNPMNNRERDDEHTELPSPSWEILCLIGPYMQPETLAVASCVSTTWLDCFSSEDLWKMMLTAHDDPSDFAAVSTMGSLSYKRLVSAVAAESLAKRRCKNEPTEPKISLSDLVFIVNVSAGTTKSTVVKQGKDLVFGKNERFQIEADVSDSGFTADMKQVRIVWKVVFKDYQKIFTISDTVLKSLDTKVGWFTDELPAQRNRYLSGSNLVGDFKPSFKDEALDKIVLAIADSSHWGSKFVDDVLRYLQCFLLD